jgi:hypothetical protein
MRIFRFTVAHVIHIRIHEVANRIPAGTVERSVPKLWEALSSGRVAATGLGDDGIPRTVDAFWWEHLVFSTPRDDVRESVSSGSPEGPILFRAVTVAREDLFREFGAPLGSLAAVASKDRSYDGPISAALRALWPQGVPPSVRKKERNQILYEYMRDKLGFKQPPPSARTYQRFFRELATTRQSD